MVDPAYLNADTGVLTDGAAWVAMHSIPVPSAVSAIEFDMGNWTGIKAPSQYVNLVVVMVAQDGVTGQATGEIALKINDNSNNNDYDLVLFSGDGGGSFASTRPTASRIVAEVPSYHDTATKFGGAVMWFHDINSAKYKTVLIRCAADRDGAGVSQMRYITWAKTDPIEILRFGATENGIAAGSRFDLYGVLPRMVTR